ncbi:hypothetical protein [Aeromonas salmonicida]|uniref:hypothetical protein n=1 Tax=Aeromonas salmonicida TaxID=645 RepID=UPI000F783ACA|nr:hypothetical protein [Aeromonas salmonicida]RSM31227.1 hypothetical protein C5B77_10040 [Aeromonas salmonicida]HEH9409704.1 hypothetical protein [Aeromonas salmonicida]
MKIKVLLAIASLYLIPSIAISAPTKFPSVNAMMEEFGDYDSGKKNTYELITSKPLHIRLSPLVYPNDSIENIAAGSRQALVYGIYRTLINTNAKQVTVTVIPSELDTDSKTTKLLTDMTVTVTKNRQQAMNDISHFMKIKSLDEMVDDEDFWSEKFESSVYGHDEAMKKLATVILK